MAMDENLLKQRTKQFALRAMKLVEPLLTEANELTAIMVASHKTASPQS